MLCKLRDLFDTLLQTVMLHFVTSVTQDACYFYYAGKKYTDVAFLPSNFVRTSSQIKCRCKDLNNCVKPSLVQVF